MTPRRVRRPASDAYLRLRPAVTSHPGAPLTVGDVADVLAPPAALRRARAARLGAGPGPGERLVLPALVVLATVRAAAPHSRWQVLDGPDTVVEGHRPRRRGRWLLGLLVWLLLFVGAATTLLNFHADVNMPAAHRQLYYLATGRHAARPYAVEIPYAIGVGLGAMLFFAVPRGRGRDPGPLEIEITRYESRLRAYWRRRRP